MIETEGKLKIICPFCGAEYDAEMTRTLDVEVLGSCSCGSWSQHHDVVEIICSNCKKVVYKKEILCDKDLD